ncbi:MAG: MbcA/ParS/Xre antitoxin family protein [Halioglobus sp.]|nr:MbcA/ParS/Xre antitoxin family protein [Halioglobus sp.]
MSNDPTLKDWQPDAERLAFAVHRALTNMGGYEDGAFDGLLGSNWARGIEADSTAAQKAALLLRAYEALCAHMGGGKENMHHWMQTPNTGTGGTPIEQIAAVPGLNTVVTYLESMP